MKTVDKVGRRIIDAKEVVDLFLHISYLLSFVIIVGVLLI